MCGDDDGIDGVGIRIAGGKGACEGPAPRPAVRWEQGRGGVSCATHSGLRPVSTSIWASMAGGHRVSRGWCRRGRAAPCCGIRQQRRAELARIQISHSLSVERPRGSHSSSRQKQERAHITATCPTPHATRHAPHAPSYLCETPSLGPCSSRGGYCCRRPPTRVRAVEARARGRRGGTHGHILRAVPRRARTTPCSTAPHSLPLAPTLSRWHNLRGKCF